MELTSPLTTLGSISTPESYYTAHGSPSNAADETSLSSPIEGSPPDYSVYRDAVQLPHELKSHLQIHLEEQLYTAAIHILSGLLGDGTTTNATTYSSKAQQLISKPVRVPPPSQIALLATLTIHPLFTSRPPETNNLHVSAYALSYLRSLLSTAGAVNANFRAAFDFTQSTSSTTSSTTNTRANSRSTTATSDNDSHSSGSTSSDESDTLHSSFARSELLFRRAPSFWAVLGWAFRCAAEYNPSSNQRWRHWRVWLDFFVSVLEADWDERLVRDKAQGRAGKGKSARPYPMLAGSLVVGYLEGLRRERRNVVKEVLRAVFAFCDGENAAGDRAAFGEVFERETAVGKGKSKRKRGEGEEVVVDLENDRFGDYLDGDDFDESDEGAGGWDSPTPSAPKGRRKRKPKGEETPRFTLTDAIAETVPFRLRIFRLLSAVSYYLSDSLAAVDELYERFTDHVRALPLPLFRLFVQSHASPLPEDVHVSFLRTVIEDLLPRTIPDPEEVDPDNPGLTTLLVVQECFLPFAAGRVTAEDNAKLSLALESLLAFVYSRVEVRYSAGLRRAVEKGIKAREDRIKRRGGGKGLDAAEREAREVMARSARGLRVLVDAIEAAGK